MHLDSYPKIAIREGCLSFNVSCGFLGGSWWPLMPVFGYEGMA
jgi:hypothetical protein